MQGDGESTAVILFGPPGSGKGTQAKLIQQQLNVPHISTGDMLRVRMQVGDELGQEIRKLLAAGELVTDELANRMVEERIQAPDCAHGFILDGYPRTVSQADAACELLERQGIGRVVIHLKVDYNRIIARISGRRFCPSCGALFNLTLQSPKQEGVCDGCGTALAVREDDRESVVRRRLEAYEAQTRPLLEYFAAESGSFHEVDGATAAPALIATRICELIRCRRAASLVRH